MLPTPISCVALLALLSTLPTGEEQGAFLQDDKALGLALARVTQSDLATRLAVGESRQGRRIEALRMAGGEASEPRPAVLIVGGLECAEAWNSGLVLGLARRLTEEYAQDEAVRDLLDSTTLYFIPRANPDACQARFEKPLAEKPATGPGGDEDRDARRGEDGPEDINGDGVIAWMRVPDPSGEWMADALDPRVLIPVEGHPTQRWRLVPEGLDSDGDGKVAEDPPLDVEVDRNFPAGFEEHTPRAGAYATSEPESRALCDFVLAHPDIQMVLVYGSRDNLASVPEGVPDDAPDVQRLPPPPPRQSDAAILRELAQRYKKLTGDEGGERGDDSGTFARWCAEHRGLWTLAIDPWSIPDKEEAEDSGSKPAGEETSAPRLSRQARHLAWLEARGVEAHLGWEAFAHPTLGAVEIGGPRPYAESEPPPGQQDGLLQGQRDFLVSLGADLARLEIREASYRRLGGGLLEVRVTVGNGGRLPLFGVWARRTRTTRPARVELVLPEGGERLAGPPFERIEELDGGAEKELRWLVKASPPIGVRLESDHAGRERTTCTEVER